MDASFLPMLRQRALDIVRKASRAGGPLEKGDFTMAIARRSLSDAMGFGEDGLDGEMWRIAVKEEVQRALVSGEGGKGSRGLRADDTGVGRGRGE